MSILAVPPEMARVDGKTFTWFVKSLTSPKREEFGNGVGHFEDNTLVAACVDGDRYFVRIKKKGAK